MFTSEGHSIINISIWLANVESINHLAFTPLWSGGCCLETPELQVQIRNLIYTSPGECIDYTVAYSSRTLAQTSVFVAMKYILIGQTSYRVSWHAIKFIRKLCSIQWTAWLAHYTKLYDTSEKPEVIHACSASSLAPRHAEKQSGTIQPVSYVLRHWYQWKDTWYII